MYTVGKPVKNIHVKIDINGVGEILVQGFNLMTGYYKIVLTEQAISEHSNIADVKVFGVPNDFFGEEVCACIKLKSAAFDENEMRTVLSKQLAKYKILAHFLIYDEFPLLGSGKIDSVALKNDALTNSPRINSGDSAINNLCLKI